MYHGMGVVWKQDQIAFWERSLGMLIDNARCGQLLRMLVENACRECLLKMLVEKARWEWLLRILVENACWEWLLRILVKKVCWGQLLRMLGIQAIVLGKNPKIKKRKSIVLDNRMRVWLKLKIQNIGVMICEDISVSVCVQNHLTMIDGYAHSMIIQR